LHLQKEVSTSDETSQKAIGAFLQSNGDAEKSSSIVPRLFCWIQRSSSEVLASTEAFDGNNRGAIVFINTASRSIQNFSEIQCMTLSPLRLEEEKAKNGSSSEGTDNDENAESNNNSDTFLTLQLYARHCFAPTIQAMTAEQKSGGKDAAADITGHDSKLLSNLQSKIRELDLTLSRARQSTLHSIPHVFLQTHPVLQSLDLSKTSKISLEDLGLTEYLTNDTFLNEVQSKVNSWIALIRKVTSLPSSHTFSQSDLDEVSYWSNLHSALSHIREELSKPSTLLTLSLLKSAKRFVTTIALENNTGLESAESVVTDVHQFLKGYPAEALASAGDWDHIMDALEKIFDHLPKVRQSRYYDLKVVELLEASTATLRDRIDFTLRNDFKSNGVVMVDFDTYEKEIYAPTQDIFVRFEDLYSQFVEFVLEFGRKRGVSGDKTPAQIVQDVNLHHLPLRERLNAIHGFRSQHEKLRLVVTEVLIGEDDEEGSDNLDGFSAIGAIREIEQAPNAIFSTIDVLDLSEKGQVAFENALESYERKIDAIEERLARLLRTKLTACQVREMHVFLCTDITWNKSEQMFLLYTRTGC
jgi:hypothetical protein